MRIVLALCCAILVAGCGDTNNNNNENENFITVIVGPTPIVSACSNDLDDDGDGKTDFPADPGCSSKEDTSEVDGSTQPPPSQGPITCDVRVNGSDSNVTIIQGQHISVSWNTLNSSSNTASGIWSGNKTQNGSESIQPSSSGPVRLDCSGPGGSSSDVVQVTVNPIQNPPNNPPPNNPPPNNPPTQPSCPTSINYSPSGGSIAANGTRQLSVTGWPSGSSSCQPFWYLDRPTLAQITGADTLIVINGRTYYAGMNAVLRGVSAGGPVSVCVQTSLTTPEVKRCYNWTVTAATASTQRYIERSIRLRHMNVPGVSQTYPY